MRWRRDVPVGLALVLLAGSLLACGSGDDEEGVPPDTTAAEETVPQRTIQQVMGEYGNRWMVRPEVTGMGIGRCDGEPCIVIYLARELPDDAERLPEEVEGYRVRTEVIGRVVPRGGSEDDG